MVVTRGGRDPTTANPIPRMGPFPPPPLPTSAATTTLRFDTAPLTPPQNRAGDRSDHRALITTGSPRQLHGRAARTPFHRPCGRVALRQAKWQVFGKAHGSTARRC